MPGLTLGRGFTLVEALVVMTILALFATLAVPAVQGPLRKSRRAQALAALTAAHQNQEVRRSNQPEYDPRLDLASLQASRAHDHYEFIGETPPRGTTSTSYRFAATARTTSSQAHDQGCQFLVLEVVDGDIRRLAGVTAAAAVRGPAADACWGQP